MSIEQKIAELLEESEKLQAEEVIEENTAEEEAVLDEETSVIEEVEEIIRGSVRVGERSVSKRHPKHVRAGVRLDVRRSGRRRRRSE